LLIVDILALDSVSKLPIIRKILKTTQKSRLKNDKVKKRIRPSIAAPFYEQKGIDVFIFPLQKLKLTARQQNCNET